MGNLIFIIGGARSGKSRYAVELGKGISRKVCFIATCIPKDKEMKKRIALHKRFRPRHWKVIEEPKYIKPILTKSKSIFDVIILDCLGLLISNYLMEGQKAKKIEKEVESIAKILSKAKFSAIVVSNEVGSGIVPRNILGRQFRDILGLSNQIMAKKADVVYMMEAGIPIKIKYQKSKIKRR